MAYNTVPIKKDSEGKPIPQYYDKVKNNYEVLEGHNGASKVILYDKDGNEVDLKKELGYLVNETTGISDYVSGIPDQLIIIDDRLLRIIDNLEDMGEGISLRSILDDIIDLERELSYIGNEVLRVLEDIYEKLN